MIVFVCLFCLFFFFKQKTAYEMRISDWSSDVCSSDLSAGEVGLGLGMALQAGVGGGAVEQRHRLLAAELEGASEVDRSLHVLVAVEMAKAAVGPGGGETGVMVDRGVEVGHGAGEIALDRKSTRLNSSH